MDRRPSSGTRSPSSRRKRRRLLTPDLALIRRHSALLPQGRKAKALTSMDTPGRLRFMPSARLLLCYLLAGSLIFGGVPTRICFCKFLPQHAEGGVRSCCRQSGLQETCCSQGRRDSAEGIALHVAGRCAGCIILTPSGSPSTVASAPERATRDSLGLPHAETSFGALTGSHEQAPRAQPPRGPPLLGSRNLPLLC